MKSWAKRHSLDALQPLKVFLICSGLGHIRRGYESFAQECFQALRFDPALDITLFQGGESGIEPATTLWNWPRNHPVTQLVAAGFRTHPNWGNPYFLEQASFGLSLLPRLYQHKPDVVFFSDFALGTLLWHWRRLSGLSYRLLFSNGAPNGPPFSRMDHVQHLTPTHYQLALNAGESPSRHSLVPYGIQVSSAYTPLAPADRQVQRDRLHLPRDRPLILSVGTINPTHKRMDYLIQEVAQLPEPRPMLLLLGQMDEASPQVIQMGQQLLGTEYFQARTVHPQAVSQYYQVADSFVLASLSEGFGRVFLEAMAHGLPCLAHDYPIPRFVLQEHGFFADFTRPGSLTALLQTVLAATPLAGCYTRHQAVYERFSWSQLRSAYVDMLYRCVNSQCEGLVAAISPE